jgi:endonuclease/exonuclease/phosphatase (EEP) superfamily protein YafD
MVQTRVTSYVMKPSLSGLLKFNRTIAVVGVSAPALVTLLLSAIGFLPSHGYFVDTCSQLRLLFLLTVIPLVILALLLRSKSIASIGLLILFINGIPCLPMLLPAEAPATATKLTLVAANVWGAHNKAPDRFIKFVHETRPDVICIEEETPQWLRILRNGLPDYPYSFDEGISGGSAIFSKIPIQQVVPPKGTPRRYGVRGELIVGGQKMLLIASHPPAPLNRKKWLQRNLELIRLSDDVRTSEIPVVLAGDFNSTPWSRYFQQLVQTAKLDDSETGHGLQPSWSTIMPLPLVPIDHCVYTKELAVITRQIGPNFGSDHLPLVVKLGIRPRAG